MNTGLLDMQSRFQQHLLGAADAAPLLAGSAERRALGLAIYANAYRRRLLEALADAYPKAQLALGAERFEAAALSCVALAPPITRSLRWFGGGFAAHLRTLLPEQPALAELAQLEWALRNAFDGADCTPLAATDLAAIAPPEWATLRFTLVPTAELLRFEHNAVAVWQALDDATAPPPFAPCATPLDWLVWRAGLQPHFRSLSPLEAALLRALRTGATFADACEDAAAEAERDCGVDIGVCLRRWLDEGVLGEAARRSRSY